MRITTLILISLFILSCSKKVKKGTEVTKVEAKEEKAEYNILEAFSAIEINMRQSRSNIELLKDSLISTIKTKDKEIYKRALISDRVTQDFINYVQAIKDSVEIGASGNDDIAGHYNLMISRGKGSELKKYINSTRENLLALLTKEEQKKVKSDLVTKDPNKNQTWESELFEHSPAAAVVTLLEKFKNDALNTNMQVINALLKWSAEK